MKKFIPKLLLLSGLAMAIASCSKKDSASPTGDIVGKWFVASDTVRVYQGATLIDTEPNTEVLPTDYVQFNQDGSGSELEYGIKVTFTYTYKSALLHFIKAGATIDGVYIKGYAEDVTVKQLDSHTLYTIQTSPDTVGNTIYKDIESIHFTK